MECQSRLKTCPVCRTNVFDDMDVCFNCMYRFGSNEKLEEALARESPSDMTTGPPRGMCETARGDKCLFGEFLVEFDRFLGRFIGDHLIHFQ